MDEQKVKIFDAIFEKSQLLVIGLDPEGRVLLFNPASERVSGYRRAEVLGRNIWDFLVPEREREKTLASFADFRAGIPTGPFESTWVTKDGEERLIAWNTSIITGEGGRPEIGLGLGIDITEHRRAEVALERREEYLGLLIGNALDLITVVRKDGTISYVSPSVQRLLGYDPGELIGKGVYDFIHPDDRERSVSNLAFAMGRPGITEYAEQRVRHKDGGWRVHEASSCNLLDNPVVEGVVINSRDITERKRAEEELLRASSQLESVFRALPDLFFRARFDGTIVDYRAGRPTDLYAPPEEFMGKKVQDALPPEAGERIIRAIREAVEGDALVAVEYALPMPEGEQVFEARIVPSLAEEVVAVIRNITERKRADEALKRSEENYRVTFESTGTAMIIIGLDGTILDANRESERLMGYTREEVVGKKKYMEFIHPEDLEMAKRHSLQLLRGEVQGPIEYEARTVRGDGSVIDTLVHVSMLPGISKSVASLLDITEKKLYEKELENRAEQLRDFLDVAAHELRHPATLLKGYAMTLQEYGGDLSAPDIGNSLGAIMRGVDKLTSVVEDLLDVSRIERGSFSLAREYEEVKALADKAVEEMVARGMGNPVRVDFSEDLGPIWMDSDKILRLMIILLDNAVKYSPPNSPIEIRGEVSGGEAVVSVMDRGVGTPEEHRDMIFERFYQVGDVLHHSSPGLGLGLYIGRRIVEAHGGRIWHEPRPGGGSIFRFSLPM